MSLALRRRRPAWLYSWLYSDVGANPSRFDLREWIWINGLGMPSWSVVRTFLRNIAFIGRPIAFLVLVGGVAALLVFDRENRLAYVKTLAWPAVVLFALMAFGGELRHLVNRVTRAQTPFGTIDLVEVKAAVEEGARVLDRQLADSESADRDIDGDGHPSEPSRPDEDTARAADAETRRQAIERAINLGAEWGFQARGQYATPPTLTIQWDGDEPHVIGAWGSPGGEPGSDRRRREAEDEVRRLQRELELSGLSADIGKRFVLDGLLKDAKRRLRIVAPDSTLLL